MYTVNLQKLYTVIDLRYFTLVHRIKAIIVNGTKCIVSVSTLTWVITVNRLNTDLLAIFIIISNCQSSVKINASLIALLVTSYELHVCMFDIFSKLSVRVLWKHCKPALLYWPRGKQRKCKNDQFGIM